MTDKTTGALAEQPAIPTVITCPFCSSEHVPGWLHDYNMDRGAYGEQPAIKQDLTPEQPAQQFTEDAPADCKRLAEHGAPICGRCHMGPCKYTTPQAHPQGCDTPNYEAAHGITGEQK